MNEKLIVNVRDRPKKAMSKRQLENRKPKLIENPKTLMLTRTMSASRDTKEFLRDLQTLRQAYTQKLNIAVQNPINEGKTMEQLGEKLDASLFIHCSDSKKRPNNVVFGRMHNFEIIQQYEFELQDYIGLQDIRTKKPLISSKPCLLFIGEGFDTDPQANDLRNLFIDMFRLRDYQMLSAQGLQYCLAFYFDGGDTFKVRSYVFNDVENEEYKSITTPFPMTPMGFQFNLVRRRHACAKPLVEAAIKLQQKANIIIKGKGLKNGEKIKTDEIGRQIAQIHVHPPKESELNLRKFKGLNPRNDVHEEGEALDGNEEYYEEEDEQNN